MFFCGVVAVYLVMTVHTLGATSELSIPTRGQEGPAKSEQTFLQLTTLDLTVYHHQRQHSKAIISISIPTWLLCYHSSIDDEHIDPDDSMQVIKED